MSLPDNNEENKISPVDNSASKNDGNKFGTTGSQLDTHENHGAIPKIFNKTNGLIPDKTNSSFKVPDDLIASIDNLALSPDNSEDNICKTDWLKARDSLENLIYVKPEKAGADISNSKSTSFTSSMDKCLIAESPHSESIIGTKNSCSNSVSKVLAWDPWDKLGRKNKKEMKRRKFEKLQTQAKELITGNCMTDPNRKDFKSGDEVRPTCENVTNDETYEYQPYQPRNIRSVEFTNEVMVVYIKEDKVIGEAKEPLKKELEQQIRNKEMRKGHMTDIPYKKKLTNDWFK